METFNNFYGSNVMMTASFIQTGAFPESLNFLELQNTHLLPDVLASSPQNYRSSPSVSPKYEPTSVDSSTTSDEEWEQTTPDLGDCCRICGRRTITNRKVHLFTQTGLSNRYQQRLCNAIRFICNDPSFNLPESEEQSSFFCRKCHTKLISFEKAASNLREVFLQNPSSQKALNTKPGIFKRFEPYNKQPQAHKNQVQRSLSPICQHSLSPVRFQNATIGSNQDLGKLFNQASSSPAQPVESLGRLSADYQSYGFTEVPPSAVALDEY